MKKQLTALVLGALVTAAMPVTAFAANHGHTAATTAQMVSVCSIENCTQTGTRDHDGKAYSGHHREDGHTYHTEQHNSANGHSRHSGNGRHHS